MQEKLKIAILGYGHIGKKHAEMVTQNEACELVALIDPEFETEAGKSISVPIFFTLNDFLKSRLKADIVAICTPNGFHNSQGIQLVNNGIHVIIEKPITLNSIEALQLENLATEKGVHVFPVMQNRFSPPAVWLKGILDANLLGKIYMVQVSCFWNRNEQYYAKGSWRGTKNLDGGTLYTQFSHYLDIMYWLFGDITNIKSKFADFNHQNLTEFEDSGIITFDLVSGGMGSFSFSTATYSENLESSLTIIAENGSVKIGGQYMNEIEKCNIKDYPCPQLPLTNGANDYGSFKGSAQNHQHLYQNIVEFLTLGKKIQTTTQDSVKVLEMIEKIYSSR